MKSFVTMKTWRHKANKRISGVGLMSGEHLFLLRSGVGICVGVRVVVSVDVDVGFGVRVDVGFGVGFLPALLGLAVVISSSSVSSLSLAYSLLNNIVAGKRKRLPVSGLYSSFHESVSTQETAAQLPPPLSLSLSPVCFACFLRAVCSD